MSKGTNQNAEKNNTMMNMLIAVIVIAFIAAGIYATYGKISEGIEDRAITNGEKPKTVKYLAKQAGMSVDDFLAQYGLAIGDTISEDTTEADMTDNMTLENYVKYSEMPNTAEEIIADAGLEESVTKDTLWKDFYKVVPIGMLYDENTLNQIKTQYNLGDEVTADMPNGDFEALMEQKAAENGTAAAAESDTAAEQGETAETQDEAAETQSEEAAAEAQPEAEPSEE